MTLIDKIQAVFPRTTEIPARLLNDIPCIQVNNRLVINTQLILFHRPSQIVGQINTIQYFLIHILRKEAESTPTHLFCTK